MYYRRNNQGSRIDIPQTIHGLKVRDFKAALGHLRVVEIERVQSWMNDRVPFIAQHISPIDFQQLLITIKAIGGGIKRTKRLFNVVVDMIIDAELNQNLDTLQAAIESPADIEVSSNEPKTRRKTKAQKEKAQKKKKAPKGADELESLQHFLDTRQYVDTLEIIDILNDLPRHYFVHEGVSSSIVNLTPHPMYFMEKDENGVNQVITLGRSGMYLRAVPPRQWSKEGSIKFGRHFVGQNIKFLRQSMRHERNTLYAYLAPINVPKSRTDYFAYGVFPSPSALAYYGEPHTFYIVSALAECVDPIYPNFIMPYKKKTVGDRKVVTAFQLADGVCHGSI